MLAVAGASGVELELTILLAIPTIYLPVQLLKILFLLGHILGLIDR